MISVFQRTFCATLAMLVLVAGVQPAAADRWVKIHNQTSVVLNHWFAKRIDFPSWGQNRLASEQVPPGYSTTIDLNGDANGCYFSFRAEFNDGRAIEARSVKVCDGATITYNDE